MAQLSSSSSKREWLLFSAPPSPAHPHACVPMMISRCLNSFSAVLIFSNLCFVLYLFFLGILGRFLGHGLEGFYCCWNVLLRGGVFHSRVPGSLNITVWALMVCFSGRSISFTFYDIQCDRPTSRADPRG